MILMIWQACISLFNRKFSYHKQTIQCSTGETLSTAAKLYNKIAFEKASKGTDWVND